MKLSRIKHVSKTNVHPYIRSKAREHFCCCSKCENEPKEWQKYSALLNLIKRETFRICSRHPSKGLYNAWTVKKGLHIEKKIKLFKIFESRPRLMVIIGPDIIPF